MGKSFKDSGFKGSRRNANAHNANMRVPAIHAHRNAKRGGSNNEHDDLMADYEFERECRYDSDY